LRHGDLVNRLVDEIGAHESHTLTVFLDITTFFPHDHEQRNIEISNVWPHAMLQFLMGQHDLQQTDLAEALGSRSKATAGRLEAKASNECP
jgi:antitoxin component HigA of HigAB toxin-antitoxin module